MSQQILRNKIIYRFFSVILLIFSVYLLIRLAPTLTKPEFLPNDDYFHFWAAGNQNLMGKNPFDPAMIEERRIQEGSIPSWTKISVMLNPPWTVSLLMPFGLIPYPLSRIIWMIFSIVLLLLSGLIFWNIYSGNPKQRWLSILVVFLFAPTISVLEKGQITPIVIMGITGFIYYSTITRNDWLAGIFLALASVKPQGVLIFWLAVIFWLIYKRRWNVLISLSLSILALVLIAIVFNPHVIQQYITMLQTYQVSDWATPTIGAYLRLFWLGVDQFWLQFVPTILGGLWFVYYWKVHHTSWNWAAAIPILLFVSQLTSPYSWSHDLILVIPAILVVAISMLSDWKHWSTWLFIGTYIVINVLDLILHRQYSEFWFIWLAPSLLIWYLLAQWKYHISPRIRSAPALTK